MGSGIGAGAAVSVEVEVVEAAASKPYGFMPFTPGPGLGGHCLPVDPHYLAWKMRTLRYRTRFIELAAEVNAEMPRYVVDRVVRALNRRGLSIQGRRILLLGVAYKPDVGDVRESPALDLVELLRGLGADVAYHDPLVPRLALDDGPLASEALTAEAVAGADAVVIVTDHRAIDYDLVLREARLVVDTRNALAGRAGPAEVYPLAGPPRRSAGTEP